MSVLEKLVAKLSTKRKAAEVGFFDLVRQVGAGKEPRPEEVENALLASGKSLEDFREAVGRYEHRLDLRRKVQEGEARAKRLAELEKLLAKAREEFAEIERRHNEKHQPLREEYQALREAGTYDAQAADTELARTCPYPELVAEHDRLTAEVDALITQRKDLWEKIERAAQGVATETKLANKGDDHAGEYLQRAKAWEAKKTAYENEEREIAAEIDRVAALRNAAWERRKNP